MRQKKRKKKKLIPTNFRHLPSTLDRTPPQPLTRCPEIIAYDSAPHNIALHSDPRMVTPLRWSMCLDDDRAGTFALVIGRVFLS